jgi:hypothetical protein
MSIKMPLSLYWKCQLIGWSAASAYWGYAAFRTSIEFDFGQGIADFTGDVLAGILLTHAYRHFALRRQWHTLTLKALVGRMATAIIVLSLLYMVLIIFKLYLVRSLFNPQLLVPAGEFFTANWLTIFITGTRLLSIWVLAWHLYHYAQREIHTAKENARLSVIEKEARLNKLSAQLNPHFFFNSLGNIKFMVTENPGSARRAIDLLSDLLRNSLYGKDDALLPAREEVSLVKDYLELEKLRFEERLQIAITIDDALLDTLIPPFSIQVLVENAIKHGIEKTKEGGLITMNLAMKDGQIMITVQSPGELHIQQHSRGLGLKNLEERLRLQYNGKASFTIREVPGKQVLATLLIPAT